MEKTVLLRCAGSSGNTADKLCLISNPSRNPVVGPGPGQVSSKGNRQNVSSQIQNEPSKQCKYMFDVLIFVVEVLVKDQKEKNGEGKGGKFWRIKIFGQ